MTMRSFLGGLKSQGQDEEILYWFNTTDWGSDPTGVIVKVFDQVSEVTDTVTTGSPIVSGDKITLPLIHDLVAGALYRVEVLFVCGGNTFEAYFDLKVGV